MPGPQRAVLRGLAAKGGSLELHASCSFLTSDEAIRLSRPFLPQGEILYQGNLYKRHLNNLQIGLPLSERLHASDGADRAAG